MSPRPPKEPPDTMDCVDVLVERRHIPGRRPELRSRVTLRANGKETVEETPWLIRREFSVLHAVLNRRALEQLAGWLGGSA